MKRSKKLIILAVTLVALAAAAAVAVFIVHEDKPAEEQSTSLFSVDSKEILEISWTCQNQTVKLISLEGQWYCRAGDVFLADCHRVQAILDTLAEVKAIRTLDAVTDLKQYGLTEQSCNVTVLTDKRLEFKIGSASGGENGRYLSIGDGKVYLVDASLLEPFSYGMEDMIQKEKLPEMKQIQEVQVKTQNHFMEMAFQPDGGIAYSDDYCWYMKNEQDLLPLDPERTEDFLNQIRNLEWKECAAVSADKAIQEQFGFKEPTAVITVHFGENGTKKLILELGEVSGDYGYARLSHSNMIYKIEKSAWEALCYTTYYDLMPDDVLRLDWDTVTAVDIEYEGKRHTITIMDQNKQPSEIIGIYQGAEQNFTGIKNLLCQMESSGYAYGAVPTGVPQLKFIFWRGAGEISPVELSFYRFNLKEDLILLNGQPYLFTARESVQMLLETIRQQIF